MTLDTHAVTAAIKHAIAKADPKLAPKAGKLKSVRVPIGGSEVPHVGDALRTVARVRDLAIALAILLIGGALLLVHDRKMFRRAGRTARVPRGTDRARVRRRAASARVEPRQLLGHRRHMLEVYGHRVLFSAGVLAVVGISTWLIAVALPARRRSAATPEAPATAPYVPPIARRTPSSEGDGLIPEKLYL